MYVFRYPPATYFCKENMPKKGPLKNRKIETEEREKRRRFPVPSPFFSKKNAAAESGGPPGVATAAPSGDSGSPVATP